MIRDPDEYAEAARVVMGWVDRLTDEQRALVHEFGASPVKTAMGMGVTTGPQLRACVVAAVRRASERRLVRQEWERTRDAG